MVWLRRGVIAVLAAVVAVVGFASWRINEAAGDVIEVQGTRALGVDTTIDFISVGFFPPSLRIGGMQIANPPGFDQSNFFTLKSGALRARLPSLLRETVVAPYLVLDGVEVVIERGLSGSNYAVILGHLEQSDSGRASAPPPNAGGPGKTFRIERIVVKDLVARLGLSEGGESRSATVEVPHIELGGVGEGAEGVVAGSLLNAVVVGILEALARHEQLPPDLAGELLRDLAGLRRVPVQVTGTIVQTGDALLED